ncbi:hypothetical protein ABT354_18995 [Streptomyces sp. NPDC000594]|uniref:hypothetical protein n=1 Tax=Streptomyces sp. NPDC000594 TaxID=3154261 RepID=UPI003317E410
MSLNATPAPDGPYGLRMIRLRDCDSPQPALVVPRVAFTLFVTDTRAGRLDHLLATEAEMADARTVARWSHTTSEPVDDPR